MYVTGLQLNVDAIASALASGQHAEKLVRNYGLEDVPSEPRALVAALIEKLGQQPSATNFDPIRQEVHNDQLFRAAALALGSDSIRWTRFLGAEPTLAELLHGYSVRATCEALDTGTLNRDDLLRVLPNQYKGRAASALIRWARRLDETADYYGNVLVPLAASFTDIAGPPTLDHHRQFLCVAGYLAQPPRRWPGGASVSDPLVTDSAERKLPGMQVALACEFLRNLHWDGFKPDRHIMNVLPKWLGSEMTQFDDEAVRIGSVVGRRSKDFLLAVKCGLAGLDLTPAGYRASEADNLVWLLASTVSELRDEPDWGRAKYLVRRPNAPPEVRTP